MSVIGRLDEQVDAVLITPLGKRDGQKISDTAPVERAPDTAESSAQKGTPAPSDKEVSEHEPSCRDELPVWLL